jgi:hypothetical protein
MSGVFLPKSSLGSAEALAQAIRYFSSIEPHFQAQDARENAQRFEYAVFFRTWRRFAGQVKIPLGDLPAGLKEVTPADITATAVGER